MTKIYIHEHVVLKNKRCQALKGVIHSYLNEMINNKSPTLRDNVIHQDLWELGDYILELSKAMIEASYEQFDSSFNEWVAETSM